MKKILFYIAMSLSAIVCMFSCIDAVFVIVGFNMLNSINNVYDYDTAKQLLEIAKYISTSIIIVMTLSLSLFISVEAIEIIEKFRKK